MEEENEDQKRLRRLADAIKGLLDDAGVGGCIALASEESAHWLTVIPAWSGLQLETGPDGSSGPRLRMTSRTPDGRRQIDSTLHMFGAVRDLCGEYEEIFGSLFLWMRTTLEAHGAEVEWQRQRGPTRGQVSEAELVTRAVGLIGSISSALERGCIHRDPLTHEVLKTAPEVLACMIRHGRVEVSDPPDPPPGHAA